ncbi:MAG: YfiR family protein [Terriglobales bacterium]
MPRTTNIGWIKLLLTAAVALLAPLLHAQKTRPAAYQVEAAYLAQFGNFVTLPAIAPTAEDDAHFSICVMGDDQLASALESVAAGEKVGHLQVTARAINSIAEAQTCRVLFLSANLDGRLHHLLSAVAALPVLTVSDASNFTSAGGIIGFVLINDRVRFAVNLNAARRAHLKLSAQLLKVASSVFGTPAQQ